MGRRGRGGRGRGEGAGRKPSKDWSWALLGLWVKILHNNSREEEGGGFMCWNTWCGNGQSRFI